MKKLIYGGFLLTLLGIGVVGCKKTNPIYENKSSKEMPSLNNHEKALWPWAVIWLIIELSEGQRTGTISTTHPDETVSISMGGCSGIGTCAGYISNDGEDIGSLNEFPYSPDYSINAGIGIGDDNQILLIVNKSEELVERFFYSDSVDFLSDEYLVDQQTLLNELKINSPFKIQPGKYKVHERNEYKYIVIGKNK